MPEKRYKISKQNPDATEEILQKESEFTDEEAIEFINLIKKVRKGMRQVLKIEEVYLIQAKKEDKIIILPGFSMTTINYGETNTLMSNWVHDEIENEYGLFSETHGACYYILKGDNNEIRFVKNDSYKKIPELIKLKPKIFPQELEDLDFLITPEKYQNFLTVNNLYEKIN